MLATVALLPLLSAFSFGQNSTVNSTIPSNSTSNGTDPIVVICPRDWFSNDSCVLAEDWEFDEIDFSDQSQCTRAHSSLYLCLSHPVRTPMTYRDEVEELLDDEDY